MRPSYRELPSLALLVLIMIVSCGTQPPSSPEALQQISLPQPRQQSSVSLEEALTRRRSVRDYSSRLLSWEEISQLLWAAQGVTHPRGYRTAPSAGALYPLEIYVLLPGGWYHYEPQGHQLELLGSADLREDIWAAGLRQDPLRNAPAVFVLTAVVARTEAKYGQRAERYVQLEAGHAAQNLLLQAVALDLGAVPIGAFQDEQVRAALELPASQLPLYLIPVGESE